MPLEDSPSLDIYKNGIPNKLPDLSKKKKLIKYFIYGLLLLTITLGVTSLLKSNTIALLSGSGSISGFTVNENNQPVSAEVFLSGFDESVFADENGYFLLKNLPPGDFTLLVGYDFVAQGYPVTIKSGKNVDLGYLEVSPPHKPSDF